MKFIEKRRKKKAIKEEKERIEKEEFLKSLKDKDIIFFNI